MKMQRCRTMKRTDKYIDTPSFHFFNANPKNRITDDCVIRAISTALNQDYNETVLEMAQMWCKLGYAISSTKGIEKYLEQKGWTKFPQPKKSNGTKYQGFEWCSLLQKNNNKLNMIANIGGHHIVAIVGNRIYDIWDSSNGCIGNFWIPKNTVFHI